MQLKNMTNSNDGEHHQIISTLDSAKLENVLVETTLSNQKNSLSSVTGGNCGL